LRVSNAQLLAHEAHARVYVASTPHLNTQSKISPG
jgi:hypothetical protein